MNVLVFLTDQQRAIQHFPPGWAKRNMPGLTRLQQHGLTFENAFTNACMCSPARSTLMSGYFPAQHGVKYTLETDMPAPQYPQVELATSFKNPATVVAAAGYTPVYKGKFHCNKPANGSTWVPSDVNQYGFTRWDPPDAGRQPGHPGGGRRDLRQRRPLHELPGHARGGHRGRGPVPELGGRAEPAVLHGRLAGQPARRPLLPVDLRQRRATTTRGCRARSSRRRRSNEDLSTKPTVQAQFLRLFNASGPIPTPQMKRNYLNFYGNLMKSSDAYLVKILDTLATRRPARQHARDRDRRSRRDGHRPRRDAAEELQLLRGVDPRPAGLLEPAPVQEAARRATPSSRTSTSCRRSRASSAHRPTRATPGRGSTTPTRS